jgi:SAM-dependent methyltransferase
MKPQCWNDSAIARAREIRDAYLAAPQAAAALVRSELENYCFYHSIEVAPGIKTRGIDWTASVVQTSLDLAADIDFSGKRVLDLGCRDGAMSLFSEARGATEILALDNDPSPGLVNFLVPFLGSVIQPREVNINDLDKEGLGRFDVIFCCGLIYHLQAPFWGLRQVRDCLNPGGALILETSIIDGFGDFPLVAYLTEETSPYEPTSPSFFNPAGLQRAMRLLGFEPFYATKIELTAPFDLSKHCPEFEKLFGDKKNLTISRFTGACRLKTDFSHSASRYSYFDGSHRMHSQGRDRYRTSDARALDFLGD